MPELPEVETVRRGLESRIVGQTITEVSFDWPKGFPNSPEDVNNFLIGGKVQSVKRRAKVLLIELDTNYTLVIHLKMTGQMVYRANDDQFGAGHPTNSLVGKLPDKSTRVIFYFDDTVGGLEPSTRKKRSTQKAVQKVPRASTGVSDTVIGQERWRSFGLRPKAGQRGPQLYFNDQRKFGWVRLIPTPEVPNIDFFKKVGPEPLSGEFTIDEFRSRLLRRKNSNIKAVLLDQSVVAGVGNIYADESLWGAKIHPQTLTKNIGNHKLNTLFNELRYVLELAIEKGGSTDKNYVNVDGKKGSYLTFARVFRREGQACPRCGTTIIKTRVAGRGTHFCPKCQKVKL